MQLEDHVVNRKQRSHAHAVFPIDARGVLVIQDWLPRDPVMNVAWRVAQRCETAILLPAACCQVTFALTVGDDPSR